MTTPAPQTPAATSENPAALPWTDPARARTFERWLDAISPAQGLRPDSVRLASADASFRRYLRIDCHDGNSRIVMDAPPDKEDCTAFVKVATLMQQAGVHAPEVLAWDEAQGFMLLTDLGRQTMMQAIAASGATSTTPQRGQATHDLYMAAIDALLRWQLSSRAQVLPAYDDALLSRELDLLPTWYVKAYRRFEINADQQQSLSDIFAAIKAHNLGALGASRVYVHRDFMPRNLMISPGGQALGVLDFQDAVYGPISYDIASLMRDAFLSWDEEFVIDITARYWQKARQAGLPVGSDFGEFYEAVEWMGLQRHLKVLGIFARLTLRDGKPQYLADTPRFVAYVRSTAARYRALSPLLRLLEQIEGGSLQAAYTF